MKNILSVALAGVCLSAVSAFAQTEIGVANYGGNGFELWSASGISWDQAQANAVGLGGFLAALTGASQNAYLQNSLFNNSSLSGGGSGNEIWLGGSPAVGTDTSDPNNWAWVNGATWTAFDAGNFTPGEPNDDSNSHLGTNYELPLGTFNDEGDTGQIGGYLVEFSTSIPDGGSTMALMGGVMAGVAMLRRKIQK